MENIEAILCAYIEGDLDAAGKSQIEKHLKENPQHRKLLDELMSMRELVQGLPRAEAPMDLEDSLRQKVERSMLLDSSVAAAPQRQRADWWPQFFTIAAIFLLFASLCFILIKTLGPTLKPAVFTQNVTENIPPAASTDRQTVPDSMMVAAAQPQTQQPLAPASNSATASQATPPTSSPPGSTQSANAIAPSVQQLVAQSQQQVFSVTSLDLQSIRRRLENSGYGVTGASPGASSHSVLMVVNSTDPPTTNAQITQFLNSNTGISWKSVPADFETKAGATTLPSSAAIGAQVSQAQKSMAEASLVQNNIPATEPSSDLYVARGLTAQQADALRLTLTGPQNGPEVQVEMRSAQPLATTQPTVLSTKEDGGQWLRDIASSATTQPAESANSAVDLNANPTTVPSVAGGAADAKDFSGSMLANNASSNASSPLAQNKSQILLPVDAVIVLQSGTVVTNPTTQPSLGGNQPTAPQMKLVSPVATPSTQP
jgi:hypothetical protein